MIDRGVVEGYVVPVAELGTKSLADEIIPRTYHANLEPRGDCTTEWIVEKTQ